jgi:hypothetical protein
MKNNNDFEFVKEHIDVVLKEMKLKFKQMEPLFKALEHLAQINLQECTSPDYILYFPTFNLRINKIVDNIVEQVRTHFTNYFRNLGFRLLEQKILLEELRYIYTLSELKTALKKITLNSILTKITANNFKDYKTMLKFYAEDSFNRFLNVKSEDFSRREFVKVTINKNKIKYIGKYKAYIPYDALFKLQELYTDIELPDIKVFHNYEEIKELDLKSKKLLKIIRYKVGNLELVFANEDLALEFFNKYC